MVGESGMWEWGLGHLAGVRLPPVLCGFTSATRPFCISVVTSMKQDSHVPQICE